MSIDLTPFGGRKLRVGVTLHLRDGAQSIWENGIFQNCVFLVQLLNNSPAVEHAVLVRDGPGTVAHADMMLDVANVDMISVDQAMATLDVVVEMSAQLNEEWVKAFRARGGRYVWMRVGNDYVIDIERAMFNLPHAGLVSSKTYDAVWTIPEYDAVAGTTLASWHARRFISCRTCGRRCFLTAPWLNCPPIPLGVIGQGESVGAHVRSSRISAWSRRRSYRCWCARRRIASIRRCSSPCMCAIR